MQRNGLFVIILLSILMFCRDIYAVEYLPIDYRKTPYKQSNGKMVDCYYAFISSKYKPQLVVANNYSKEFLYSLNSSLGENQLEAPVDMAKRTRATLLMNLGRGGYKQPLVVDGIQMTKDELNLNSDLVYMSGDGVLNTMDISNTTYQDLMLEKPIWADFVFYGIVYNNQYIEPVGRDSYEYIQLRHPRTFLGQTSTGEYIAGVCDGRNDGITSHIKNNGEVIESEYGLKLNEIYDFVKKNITDDVRILVNADGGYSSSFVYKGQRMNQLAKGNERTRLTGIYWASNGKDDHSVKFDANSESEKKINISEVEIINSDDYMIAVGTEKIDLDEINLKIIYDNGDEKIGTAEEFGATVKNLDSSKEGYSTVTLSIGENEVSHKIKVYKVVDVPNTMFNNNFFSLFGIVFLSFGVILIIKKEKNW